MIIIHLPVWEPAIINDDVWFVQGKREAESVITKVNSDTQRLLSGRTNIDVGSLLSFLSARGPQWGSLGLHSKAIDIKGLRYALNQIFNLETNSVPWGKGLTPVGVIHKHSWSWC